MEIHGNFPGMEFVIRIKVVFPYIFLSVDLLEGFFAGLKSWEVCFLKVYQKVIKHGTSAIFVGDLPSDFFCLVQALIKHTS